MAGLLWEEEHVPETNDPFAHARPRGPLVAWCSGPNVPERTTVQASESYCNVACRDMSMHGVRRLSSQHALSESQDEYAAQEPLRYRRMIQDRILRRESMCATSSRMRQDTQGDGDRATTTADGDVA